MAPIVLLTACSNPSASQHDPEPSPDQSPPADAPRATNDSAPPVRSGEDALSFDEVLVQDGGIHGVQGHRLQVPRTGPAIWERTVDSFRPSGVAAAGELALPSTRAAELAVLAEAAWKAAAEGTVKSYGPVKDGPPRWKWTITLRRGEDTRSLEGGANSALDAATPASALALLRWTHALVDGLSSPP